MAKLILTFYLLVFIIGNVNSQIQNYPISKNELVELIYKDSIPEYIDDVLVLDIIEDLLNAKEKENWELWQVESKTPQYLNCLKAFYNEFYLTYGIRWHECTDAEKMRGPSQKLLRCNKKVNAIKNRQLEIELRIQNETVNFRNEYHYLVMSQRRVLESKLERQDKLLIDSLRNMYYSYIRENAGPIVEQVNEAMDLYCDYEGAPDIAEVNTFISIKNAKYKYEFQRIEQILKFMLHSNSSAAAIGSSLTEKYKNDLLDNFNSIIKNDNEYNRHIKSLMNLYDYDRNVSCETHSISRKKDIGLFLGTALLIIELN